MILLKKENEKHSIYIIKNKVINAVCATYPPKTHLIQYWLIPRPIAFILGAEMNLEVAIVNTDFINKASEINAIHDTMHEEEIYNITREWMKLLTDDENFIINTILAECENDKIDMLFSIINTGKIGLMGHSLGGASSAQIGRDRDDIDAVIVLDGTMLGEEVAFENNSIVLNDTPYPVPLLNIYAEDHYTNSKKFDGDAYDNFHATQNAVFPHACQNARCGYD